MSNSNSQQKNIENKLSEYEAPLIDFLSNSILVIFKNRLVNQPFTADRVKFLINPLVSVNNLPIQLTIQLYITNNKDSIEFEEILETWFFDVSAIQKSSRASVCSSSQTQLKLLYQAIYNRVKRTPLNLIDNDKLKFKLTTNTLPKDNLPPICHSFDNSIIIKRRFKIGICFYYYPEVNDGCNNDESELEAIKISALTQALRQNMHVIQKEKRKHTNIQSSPYTPYYIPSLNGCCSPIPQANGTLSSSHEDRRLLGSYEESLFRGRMSSLASHSIEGFQVQLGVLGSPQCRPKNLSCPPHKSYPFPVNYYDHPPEERGSSSPSSPYVGTLTLLEPFSIPDRGQLQFTIQNPQLTCVKVLLIPYDFSQMPSNTKTFLRQKSYKLPTPNQSFSEHPVKASLSSNKKRSLDSGVHFQVCKLTQFEALKVYGTLRIIFDPRPLEEGGDTLCKTIDYPPDPLKYTPVGSLELMEFGVERDATPGY